jgi:cyclophilin family peptidyl-prolyl cis-trans isomerase
MESNMKTNKVITTLLFSLFIFAVTAYAQGGKDTLTAKPIKKAKKMQTAEIKKGKEIVVMETSMGTIEIEMFRSEAPKTVENFVKLAEKGYYNGIKFHRVIDNFMIQGGDPTGTGSGGESIYGKKFEDEISPKLTFDRAGLLAMANAGKNTNGSQFFITLAPTTWLNGNHTIFGDVVSGLDVVKAIGKVKTSKPGDRPLTDVVMKKVYLKGSAKEKPVDKK